jgi:hypothetical protein
MGQLVGTVQRKARLRVNRRQARHLTPRRRRGSSLDALRS